MNTTTATTDQAARDLIEATIVLNGAQALLQSMYRNPCINGTGYYPREIIAQERRVAMLEARYEAAQNVECPAF